MADSKYHYMITDRYRQDVGYYIRNKSKKYAQEAIEVVEFLLNLFEKDDIPEWYTFKDLEEDKKRIEKL